MKELKNIKIYFTTNSPLPGKIYEKVYVQLVDDNKLYIIHPENKSNFEVIPLYNVVYYTIEDYKE